MKRHKHEFILFTRENHDFKNCEYCLNHTIKEVNHCAICGKIKARK